MAEAEAPETQDPGPAPELAEVVDAEIVGANAELVVRDPNDQHEVMVAMDAHDVDRLVEDITKQAQSGALKRWVYELPQSGKPRGLTVDAVQDITQRMNWTGRCSIGIDAGTLDVHVEEHDEGNGLEPFWVATVAAHDGKTGATLIGTSMEPQWMKLRSDTAAKKRNEGKTIREDNKVFDRFSRAKAINKAQRNALEGFIPEVVKQSVIAMAAKDPSRVERIQTEAEAKIAELPAPLDTVEARALTAGLEAMYDEIRELGGGKGKIELTPGTFAAYLLRSQHDLKLLEQMQVWLETRRDEIAAKYA